MFESYVVKCNLIELQICKVKVMEIVRKQKCLGFGGTGDVVTFHFSDKGQAMLTFLELETFLTNVSVSTTPIFIDKTKLKGVFSYD